MKIALCTTQKFLLPLVGGVDVYTDRLGQALMRLGHEVIVIALDPTADPNNGMITISIAEQNGFPVQRIHFSFERQSQEAFHAAYDPEMGQAVRSILRDEKPDLFIIVNFYMLTLAAVEAAKMLNIPVVHIATDFLPICRRGTFIRWDNSSCQVGESIQTCAECFVAHRALGRLAASTLGKFPEETLLRLARRRESYPLRLLKPYWNQVATMERRLGILSSLRRQIDLVLVPTQYTLDRFLENGFEPERVYHLPFGIDREHPLARVEHVSAPYTRFLFIGRLQPYKGVHLLIEAFNNLQSPQGATLTIHGAPDGHNDYFEKLKVMMNSNERIRFAGKIAPADLGEAFAVADFFVLPSTWHENSPLILLDSLQSKTPVIASAIGGVMDIVEDEVNGLLFPMGDQGALQQVMQRVIDQPELSARLRKGVELPAIDDYAKTMLSLCEGKLTLDKREGNPALKRSLRQVLR